MNKSRTDEKDLWLEKLQKSREHVHMRSMNSVLEPGNDDFTSSQASICTPLSVLFKQPLFTVEIPVDLMVIDHF